MYDQVIDNYRQTAASALQFQHGILQGWLKAWAAVPVPGAPAAAAPAPAAEGPIGGVLPAVPGFDQVWAFQKAVGETVTALLRKQNEAIDARYRAGIEAFEEALKVGQARDLGDLQRRTASLCERCVTFTKAVADNQVKEFQGAMQAWSETLAKGMAPAAKG